MYEITTSVPAEVDYDPFSESVVEDPYATYAYLRDHAPLYRNERLDFFALSRYADLIDLGRDWQTFSYAQGADIDNPGEAFGWGNFLDEDPPVHTKLRDAVRRDFTPKAIRAHLDQPVRREARALLDEILEAGRADFGVQFAWTLPLRVASELLGFPKADIPQLREWEEDFAKRILGRGEVPDFAMEASSQLKSYFGAQIEQRRQKPSGDLLSTIANASLDGGPIGDAAIGIAFLLFTASIETSACALTNGLVLLANHPDQRAWLTGHPSMIPDAVEEILRFESPLQVMKRTTTRDVDIHGAHVPEGATVMTIYGAANRDDRRWESAGQFDIHRKARRHLAFGDGIHHCLGAPLARLELCAAFEAILSDMPVYEVDKDGLERLSHYITRGFTRVPIEARP